MLPYSASFKIEKLFHVDLSNCRTTIRREDNRLRERGGGDRGSGALSEAPQIPQRRSDSCNHSTHQRSRFGKLQFKRRGGNSYNCPGLITTKYVCFISHFYSEVARQTRYICVFYYKMMQINNGHHHNNMN